MDDDNIGGPAATGPKPKRIHSEFIEPGRYRAPRPLALD